MPLAIPAQQEVARDTSTALLPKKWTSQFLRGECYVVIIRKKEYKMVVAKRQRKGKGLENGTKEKPWTRVKTSGETYTPPSWLAQFA